MKQIALLDRYGTKNGINYIVSLDKYVDTNTLICRELKTGDVIIPIGFSSYGSPKFSEDTFDKYANGESYPRIEIECKFEERDLQLPISLFDDEALVNKHVKDLKSLHEIMEVRYVAGYKKNMRMRDIKILNDNIWFDTCGNSMIKTGDNTYSTINIPKSTDVCPCCNKAWVLSNFLDFYEDTNGTFYHKKCNLFRKLHNQKKEFAEMFKSIYNLTDLDFEAIPNQYYDCDGYAPWFIVHTPDGDIEIGWRKRVISITWLDNYKKFKEDFEDENVTRGKRYIHAWSREKCVEYLRRAKESITA